MDSMDILKSIYAAAVKASKPKTLIKDCLRVEGEGDSAVLCVYDDRIPLKNKTPRVIGFGRCVLDMTSQLEQILNYRVCGGVLSVPAGSAQAARKLRSDMWVIEGGGGCLGGKTEEAGRAMFFYAQTCKEGDLLIVLISGGADELLSLPVTGVAVSDVDYIVGELKKCGATEREMSAVKKKLSNLKGGKLAGLAHPAEVVALVLSDVVGDRLEVMASGPTIPDLDQPGTAKSIIDKYHLKSELTDAMIEVIYKEETPDDLDAKEKMKLASTYVIGNNMTALMGAAEEARLRGFIPIIITSQLCEDVLDISALYVDLVIKTIGYLTQPSVRARFSEDMGPFLQLVGENLDLATVLRKLEAARIAAEGICYLFGGKPKVKLEGGGVGGRAQQLALQFAVDCDGYKLANLKDFSVFLLCAASSGLDGPSSTAGAIGYPGLAARALAEKLDPAKFLRNNDTTIFFTLFDHGRSAVLSGPTGTDVMDVHCLMIRNNTQGDS